MPADDRPGLALATEPVEDSAPKSPLTRADVVALVRDKRYEEALAVLYRARSESPNDPELQKSIGQIKEFLVGAYAKRLGGLDQVARPIPISAVRTPDTLLVARYVDGASTFGDVAQMCPLGQLRTLQILVAIYGAPEPRPAPRPQAQRGDTSPPSGVRTPSITEVRALELPVEPEKAAGEKASAKREKATRAEDEKAASAKREQPAAPVESEREEPPSSLTPSVMTPPVAQPAETEEDRRYRETFARGAAAFVQRRFVDAIEAFEACDRMRPGDRAASVMLRRARRDRDLESQ